MSTLNTRLLFVFLCFLSCVLAFAAWQLPKLKIDNNLLSLFPQHLDQSQHADAIDYATDQHSQFVTQRAFFLVGSHSEQSSRDAAKLLSQALNGEEIKKVSWESSPSAVTSLNKLYSKYSPLLLSDADRLQLQTAAQGLIQKRIRALYTNPSLINGDVFANDPFGFGERFFVEASGKHSPDDSKDNPVRRNFSDGFLQFTQGDIFWILVTVELAESSFSVKTQASFRAAVDQATHALKQSFPNTILKKSGAIFFAEAGTQQAKQEISTVGLGSALGILVLLLAIFRSVRVLIFSFVPTAIGILFGLSVCSFVFDSLHVIALVFGASLIGVSIDYSFHFLTKRQVAASHWQSDEGIRRLSWGLGMGVTTSACAYVSFVFSGFPGFQQIAVFSATGLIAACVTVAGLFPFLFKQPAANNENTLVAWSTATLSRYLNLCKTLAHTFESLRSPIKLILSTTCCGLLAILIFTTVTMIQSDDNIRNMQTVSSDLLDENRQFKQITGEQFAQQFFLVTAKSEEQLLQRTESIQAEMKNIYPDNIAITDWLPSKKTQAQNRDLILEHVVNSGISDHFFTHIRFDKALAEQWENRIRQTGSTHTGTYIQTQAIIDLVSQINGQPSLFTLSTQRHYAMVSFLLKPNVHFDTRALQKWAAEHDDIIWVDQVQRTNSLFTHYREKAVHIFVAALAIIYLILAIRYGAIHAIPVVAVPGLACFMTLVIFAYASVTISLFHVMALMLVLGIGIDYSVFMRETREHASTTLFAILLSSITTMLAFGLLALSQTHAIHSFGLTVLIGISLCFFLSPVARIGIRS